MLKSSLIGILLWITCASAIGQVQPWLTDEQARELASALIAKDFVDQEPPCFRLVRNERTENFLLSTRSKKLTENGQINKSMFIYEADGGSCESVDRSGSEPQYIERVSVHGYPFGIVVVDRATRKTYYFDWGSKPVSVFNEMIRNIGRGDNELMVASLFRALVYEPYSGNEIGGLSSLRQVVEQNFESAYSPYGRDETWEPKFRLWWRNFRQRLPKLEIGETYEKSKEGMYVHVFAYRGFELTIPRSDPPPKGVPTVEQRTLLVKPDGTVEEKGSKIIYQSK